MRVLQLEVKELLDTEICKDLYFRASTSIFTDGEGRIKATKELRLLKRMSCSGCSKCGWFWEYITETIADNPEILDYLEHGKLYTYSVCSSEDWESGVSEIDYIEFTEVKDDPKE